MLGASYFRIGQDPLRIDRHDPLRSCSIVNLALNPRNGDMAVIDNEDQRIMVRTDLKSSPLPSFLRSVL